MLIMSPALRQFSYSLYPKTDGNACFDVGLTTYFTLWYLSVGFELQYRISRIFIVEYEQKYFVLTRHNEILFISDMSRSSLQYHVVKSGSVGQVTIHMA